MLAQAERSERVIGLETRRIVLQRGTQSSFRFRIGDTCLRILRTQVARLLSQRFTRAKIHVGSVSDRKSTRLNSSHITISYAVFCLKKKKKNEHSQKQT